MSKNTKPSAAGSTEAPPTAPPAGALPQSDGAAPSAGEAPEAEKPPAQEEQNALKPVLARGEHPQPTLYRIGVGYTLLFPGVGQAMQPWARAGEYVEIDNPILREDIKGQEHKLEPVDELPAGKRVISEERLHPGQRERLRRLRMEPSTPRTPATAAAAALGDSTGIPSAKPGLAKGSEGSGS